MELTKDLSRILNIGIRLTGEKNRCQLLNTLLTESMKITASDAGYIFVKEQDGLQVVMLRNNTVGLCKGEDGKRISSLRISFDSDDICSESVKNCKIYNIPDADECHDFSFRFIKDRDESYDYHTKSLLVVPFVSGEEGALGAIILINSVVNNEIIPFDKGYEQIIYSLTSQAASSLVNINHLYEMKQQLDSMVRAFTTAIDERTPYNANHTKKVAHYTEQLVDYINMKHRAGKEDEFFSESRKEELLMAALLHDIGKLTTPLGIMNKSNRLGSNGMQVILVRFELIEEKFKTDYITKKISEEDYNFKIQQLKEIRHFIKYVDKASVLTAHDIEHVEQIADMAYINEDGNVLHYITPDEKVNLSIKKGTLTPLERDIMRNHVVITEKLLKQIRFGRAYKNVPALASAHHELLDGSGYPYGLRGDEIPKDARVLAVLDIFDSLISTDRPYKEPVSIESALIELDNMVSDGKLDKSIVDNLHDAIKDGWITI